MEKSEAAKRMDTGDWETAMKLGAKPKLGGDAVKLDGDYYRPKEVEYIEDSEGDGEEVIKGWEQMTPEEYRAAKKEHHQETRNYIRGELRSLVGVKSAEEKEREAAERALRAERIGEASWQAAMSMGAKPVAPGIIKLDGEYYRGKDTYEDEAGNEETVGWEKISKEEYLEAKRNSRRESIKLVRESFKKLFKRKKDGERE